MNGIGQTLAALGRSTGPLVGTPVFAWSERNGKESLQQQSSSNSAQLADLGGRGVTPHPTKGRMCGYKNTPISSITIYTFQRVALITPSGTTLVIRSSFSQNFKI